MPSIDADYRLEGRMGYIDFPRDVTAQTRETAYRAYNTLAMAKVEFVALNFVNSDYLNSAGIGLVISLVDDAIQADRKVLCYGLSTHYRKLFGMVGLAERLVLVENEEAAREKIEDN